MSQKAQRSFVFSMNSICRLLILAYPAEFRAEYGTVCPAYFFEAAAACFVFRIFT